LPDFEINKQRIVFFILTKNGAGDALFALFTSKKREACARGSRLVGPRVGPFFVGQALGLSYLAHSTWPHSFLVFLNYYFCICIFQNNFCFYVLININSQ